MPGRDPFRDPIPTTLHEIEMDIDYWTQRLGEGQAGSDWEYQVQTRLTKLNRAKERKTPQPIQDEHSPNNTVPVELDVFISHSSRDEQIAGQLVKLIRSALNLKAPRIRCTSVDGYRLPSGISINEQLRKEIHGSAAFVALLTPNSLSSTFVLFELGARWGAGSHLFPLLSGDNTEKLLKGPLAALAALRCDSGPQMHQFVDELAAALGREKESAAVYEEFITALVEQSKQSRLQLGAKGASSQQRSLHNSQADTWVKLRGEIGHSVKWNSSWIDLATPVALKAGDRVRLQLEGSKGNARAVIVRLLENGKDPNQPTGILTDKGIEVPEDQMIEVEVPRNFSQVVQLSVHGGTRAWSYYLGHLNGPARLAVAWVSSTNS